MATLIMSFLLIPCSHAHKESICSHYTHTLKKHLLDGHKESVMVKNGFPLE